MEVQKFGLTSFTQIVRNNPLDFWTLDCSYWCAVKKSVDGYKRGRVGARHRGDSITEELWRTHSHSRQPGLKCAHGLRILNYFIISFLFYYSILFSDRLKWRFVDSWALHIFTGWSLKLCLNGVLRVCFVYVFFSVDRRDCLGSDWITQWENTSDCG